MIFWTCSYNDTDHIVTLYVYSSSKLVSKPNGVYFCVNEAVGIEPGN